MSFHVTHVIFVAEKIHRSSQIFTCLWAKSSPGLQDLNIFNFFYVDDQVAVAQGASGSVALWGATDPEWDQKHLIPVEGE